MKRCNTFICLVLTCVILLSVNVPFSVSAGPVKGAVGNSVLYSAVPDTMELICRKGDYSLFACLKTGEFAVKNEKSAQIWYSNPPDRYDDPYSGNDRAKTFSQLALQYIDKNTLAEGFATSYEAEAEENISVTGNGDGITVLYKFYDIRIAVPLNITLTERGVKARIDVKKIKEDSDKRLLKVELLPYFGAGGTEDTGYIVVPDGCGALIEFNSGRQNLASYNEPIYGRDKILNGDTKAKLQENSALPLFGLKNGEQGFAAIVTEGDAVASVVAGISKKGSGYNNVYSSFTLRSSETIELSGKEMVIFEESEPQIQSCEVEYRFLTGDSADYTGIAKEYSSYLSEMGIKPIEKKTTSLLMELYGAVRIDRSVLGIPAKVTETLTTFKEAEDMAKQLKNDGVSSLAIVYSEYDRAAIRGKMQKKITPGKELGGARGYKRLKSALDEMGVLLISNIDLNTYRSGFFKNRYASRTLGGLPGVAYNFNLSTNEPELSGNPVYFLSPSLFSEAVTKFTKKYNADYYGAIGLDNLALNIYSDFSKNNLSDRQQTVNTFAKGAKALAESGKLYVRGGAAWLLPYTDYIYDMPSETTQTELESTPVPLYQLAVSGFVPYSLEAANRLSDPDWIVLKCAEYGADLKYDLTYEAPEITGEPTLGYLNGVWFDQWQEHAVNSYNRLSALDEVLSGKMLRHESVTGDVYITTYEGGRVAVNYSNEDVRIGNTTVKSKDFSLLGEDDSYGE